jgi:hypothetical protein
MEDSKRLFKNVVAQFIGHLQKFGGEDFPKHLKLNGKTKLNSLGEERKERLESPNFEAKNGVS